MCDVWGVAGDVAVGSRRVDDDEARLGNGSSFGREFDWWRCFSNINGFSPSQRPFHLLLLLFYKHPCRRRTIRQSDDYDIQDMKDLVELINRWKSSLTLIFRSQMLRAWPRNLPAQSTIHIRNLVCRSSSNYGLGDTYGITQRNRS